MERTSKEASLLLGPLALLEVKPGALSVLSVCVHLLKAHLALVRLS